MNVLHFNTNDRLSDFRNKFRDEKPDIVHIHTVWSIRTWCVERYVHAHKIPVVLSPGRELMPWHVQHHFWTQKLPMMLLFLQGTIRRAEAIQVEKKQEKDVLLTLSLLPNRENKEPWNDRIENTRNLEKLYKKVVDSNPFLYFHDKEKKAEDTLLRLGLSRDEESGIISTDSVTTVQQLSPEAWRNIALHALDENILEEVSIAAKSLVQAAPLPDVTTIDRFKNVIKKEHKSLPMDKALMKRHQLAEAVDEKHASAAERNVCMATLNTMFLIEKECASRRILADLYSLLRFSDYDERRVEQMMDILGIRKEAARLLQILNESLGLEEGYMPFNPINDRKTEKLRKTFNQLNIQ